jgi:hypothetical protein
MILDQLLYRTVAHTVSVCTTHLTTDEKDGVISYDSTMQVVEEGTPLSKRVTFTYQEPRWLVRQLNRLWRSDRNAVLVRQEQIRHYDGKVNQADWLTGDNDR